MALQVSPYVPLILMAAFVSGFGLIMAYFLEEDKDVLDGTAAYGAVLVVFVGANSPNSAA